MYAEKVEIAGEMMEAIQALRMAVESLTRSIGYSLPDISGRQRIVTEAGSVITTVTTLSALTNQVNIGGYPATMQVPTQIQMSVDNIRRNISVT